MTKDVFCRDKHVFVATKIILVAALANDSEGGWGRGAKGVGRGQIALFFTWPTTGAGSILLLLETWGWEDGEQVGLGGGGGRGDRSHLISIFQQTDLFCRQRSCCHSAGGQLWSTEAEAGTTGQLGWLHGDCTWWTGAVAPVFCLCCCRLTSSEAQCR